VKILFIHNRYQQPGGEDVAVELESSVLKEKGHETQFLFFDNTGITGLFQKLKTGFKAVYNPGSAIQLKRKIAEFKPDLIHIHNLFFTASPSVLYTAQRFKIPVIFTLHNYRLICANALLLRKNEICELCIHKKLPIAGIRYKCYRNSVTGSALVTLISGFHKFIGTWKNKITTYITLNEFSRSRLLQSSLQIEEHKMITKPNFIPDPGEGSPQRENFFLFAGRVVKEKGVHVLAEAFAGIPEYKVKIIGDGPEKKSLEEKFNSYPNISFTGYMDHYSVLEYMKRCKALICPSIWYEGAPLTIIEAFATGTPVIASRLGSMAESISEGYNGLHFIAGDAIDLQEKIRLFIQKTNKDTKLYQNARQSYLEKYHPDIHYKAIMNIYEDAIKSFNV
jgi:glycosyltransferase involved in cell wall biosynthesis